VRSVVGASRGIPDVSLSAALSGAVDFLVHPAHPRRPGGLLEPGRWHQRGDPAPRRDRRHRRAAAGHRLGLLNDRLYEIARHDDEAIVDVTSGANAVTLCLSACATGTPVLLPVAGYTATKGYDLASGLGTVDAAELVDALR